MSAASLTRETVDESVQGRPALTQPDVPVLKTPGTPAAGPTRLRRILASHPHGAHGELRAAVVIDGVELVERGQHRPGEVTPSLLLVGAHIDAAHLPVGHQPLRRQSPHFEYRRGIARSFVRGMRSATEPLIIHPFRDEGMIARDRAARVGAPGPRVPAVLDRIVEGKLSRLVRIKADEEIQRRRPPCCPTPRPPRPGFRPRRSSARGRVAAAHAEIVDESPRQQAIADWRDGS